LFDLAISRFIKSDKAQALYKGCTFKDVESGNTQSSDGILQSNRDQLEFHDRCLNGAVNEAFEKLDIEGEVM
jgi:hypothetical protein